MFGNLILLLRQLASFRGSGRRSSQQSQDSVGSVGEPQEVCAFVGGKDVTVPGRGSGCLSDGRRKEVLAQSRHNKPVDRACMPGVKSVPIKVPASLGSDLLISPSASPDLTPSELAFQPQIVTVLKKKKKKKILIKNKQLQTSLVIQWIGIHLPMQGTWVLSLVQEAWSTWSTCMERQSP